MKFGLLLIGYLVVDLVAANGQTSLPSVVNFKKQAELSASPAMRQATETIPDYSLKSAKPVTVVALAPHIPVINNGFAAPLGPSPKPGTDIPSLLGQTVSNFAGVRDEPTFRLETGNTNRFIPPDVGGYAGPSHLVAVSNNQMRITTKAGVELSKVDIEVFWQGTPGYATASGPFGAGDPHILYDAMADRWIATCQTALAAGSSLLVAVSQTNDPTGNWNRYMFATDVTDITSFDYPEIGYTKDWVVITGNMFPLAGGGATNHQIYIFKKADMYGAERITLDSNAQRIVSLVSSNGGWGAPVTPLDNSLAANTMYMLQPFFSSGGNAVLKMSTLTGVLPNVTWNNATATFTQSPQGNYSTGSLGNAAPQRLEGRGIQTNDGRFAQAVMRNGRIWAVQHVIPAVSPARTAIQWWQLNTNGTVVQNGRIDDAAGRVFRTFPSLAVNESEDMVVGYSIFSKDIFPSAAYALRRACTPANAMASETIFKEGVSNYWKNFGGTRARWGDYSYTSLDPSTGRFWTIQQIADQRTGAADNDSRWASWWAEVQPGVSNAVNFGIPFSHVLEAEANTAGACMPYKDISVPLRAVCKASGAGTITVSASGTAAAGDYEIITPVISMAANDFEKAVIIRVFKDQLVESEETIVLQFTVSGAGITKGSETPGHTIYITDGSVGAPVAPGPLTATIGLADNTNSNSQPFRGSFSDSRTQWLISAADLKAAGLSGGSISGLALNIASKATAEPYKELTMRIRNIGQSALATGNFAGGLTTVFGPVDYNTVAGVNSFVFSNPFMWDGSSSLLFDMCFNNTAASSNDIVQSNNTTPVITQVWARESDAAGCAIGASNFSSFTIGGTTTHLRPRTTLSINVTGNPVATVLNSLSKTSLGPNADVYMYSPTGEIMARLQNLSNHDYGCTEIIIDRAGTGAFQFWNMDPKQQVTAKTLKIVPSNANTNGQVRVTLFFTKGEVEGWQTASGQSWTNIQMLKTKNAIATYTPSQVPVADVTAALVTDKMAYGEGYAISATFSNGFSGFAAGVLGDPLPVTWLGISGVIQNGNALIQWATGGEKNNARFDIESSRNGQHFETIGQLPGKGNASARSEYAFVHQKPAPGIHYYRVRQTDTDGQFSLSRVVALKVDEHGQSKPMVYPVPSSGSLTLHFGRLVSGRLTYEILTADMKAVRRGTISTPVIQHTINIGQLPQGNYWLKIQTADGSETMPFVKQ